MRCAGIIAGLGSLHDAAVHAQPCRSIDPGMNTVYTALGLDTRDSARYQICIDPHDSSLVVLRNGTQITRLDTLQRQTLSTAAPELTRRTPDTENPPPHRSGFTRITHPLVAVMRDRTASRAQKMQALADLGGWDNGLEIFDRLEFAASRSIVMRNTLEASLTLQWKQIYLGAGYRGTLYGFSLAQRLMEQPGSAWRNSAFSFSAAVPFLRYELTRAAEVLPEYFWLEEHLVAVMSGDSTGRTLGHMRWQWETSHRRNLAHSLTVRAGRLGAQILFDRDIYRLPILTVRLERMPSIWGFWGASLCRAADTWMPGAWLELPLVRHDGPRAAGYRLPLRFAPLRIELHYYNPQRYNFSCMTSFNLGYVKEP